MIITICASIKFYPQIVEVKKQLEALGHEVLIPPHEVLNKEGAMIPVEEYYRIRKEMVDRGENIDWVWERKNQAIKWHNDKINQADVILVLNYDKNGVTNYIGGNTLMEVGVAFWLKKPIYLFNPIPEGVSYFEEIKGMRPIVINGDLNLIT
jgi:nucleoside 2-deoxyribosyltransferase